MSDTHNESAMTVDPVITWLEQVRDFPGSTGRAKELAQLTIDRLRPPAIDPWKIIAPLVDDLGTLRGTDGVLISDRPNHPSASADDAGYYGGYLVAESITRRNAIACSFLPQLLVAARENPVGRQILQQLATALVAPKPSREKVADRLDGTMRLARLAGEFKFSSEAFNERDPFYIVALALEHLAGGLLSGAVDAASADVEAWLDRKRDARHAARAGQPRS